jgi:ABC-type lipoprotein export system ATPase subunit
MADDSGGGSALVELAGVERTYRRGREWVHALADASLAVWPGEFVVVTGPSGSGKSTLLHVMAGIDRPTKGAVRLEGRPMSDMSDDELTLYRRRRIGLIFQFFHLLPTLSAAENVALPLLLDGQSPARTRPAALALLDRLGLADRAGHRPREMSGGEQQRVAIARALIARPALVLADEPTGNLDTAAGAEVYKLLRELPREVGAAVVLVTHDQAAGRAGDRSIHIRDGSLHADDAAREDRDWRPW